MLKRNANIWSCFVDATPQEILRLQSFIIEERNYFNLILAGLAAPMRSMPDTISSFTGRWEELLGEVAANRINIGGLQENAVPSELVKFIDLLFKDGKFAIDARKMVIFNVVAQSSAIVPSVRRGIAIEMIRYAREQSAAFKNTIVADDKVYQYAMATVVAHDITSKQHMQVPRNVINTKKVEDGVIITLPYLTRGLEAPSLTIPWNYLIVRPTTEGTIKLEFSQEDKSYLLRKIDRGERKKEVVKIRHVDRYASPKVKGDGIRAWRAWDESTWDKSTK